MKSTIVISGGFAGMIAAFVASEKDKVKLLTYGAGTFSLQSGVIDVLGYDAAHRPIDSPAAGIKNLPAHHPYKKIGAPALEKACEFFLNLMTKNGLPYHGSTARQILIPTAVGTLKPTCLAPKFSDAAVLKSAKKIVVVGVRGLKDFYPALVAGNLKKYFPNAQFEVAEIDFEFGAGRDLITLDVARALDSDDGRNIFVERLKKFCGDKTAFVLPSILGTENDTCAEKIRGQLNCDLVETTCLPPSINGWRLQKILMQELRNRGVSIIENLKIIRAETQIKLCKAVFGQVAAREKTFTADKFISATGGFYSGGLVMREFDNPRELIFNLPAKFPAGAENWYNPQLFDDKPQGFATTGILTDDNLNPIDAQGKKILNNVYVVGRNLYGYDFCYEHSGNGVALGSAFKAATL